MKPRALSKGHALALLLWMIAGMSLMVTAVIHLARDDIGMAELRLNEAKSRAMARALAYLAARDSALQSGFVTPQVDSADVDAERAQKSDQQQQDGVFKKQYELGGMTGTVELLPAEAFVSLNTATEEELFRLFLVVGEAESDVAYEMAVSVINYRDQPRHAAQDIGSAAGFRYREELLAVYGMRRAVYDRVKDFVHVHSTQGLDMDQAPQRLAAAYTDDSEDGDPTGTGLGAEAERNPKASGTFKQVQGQITFESVYRHKAAMLRGASVSAAMVEVNLANGHRSRLRIWIDQAGKRISRVENVAVQPGKS